jgi:hypothetical protein
MAVKTFTTGEVLTAADTNTYLNNGGLVYITQANVGTGVASVTVNSCFSSTYDNYKILIYGTNASPAGNLTLQLSGITGSVYSLGGTFFVYGSATITGYGPAATTTWNAIAPGFTANGSAVSMDLFGPNNAAYKHLFVQGSSTSSYYSFGGVCASTTQATGFVLSSNVTSISGGTIYVYGYRKA